MYTDDVSTDDVSTDSVGKQASWPCVIDGPTDGEVSELASKSEESGTECGARIVLMGELSNSLPD